MCGIFLIIRVTKNSTLFSVSILVKSQYAHESSGVVPALSEYRFLPDSVQFIIHRLPCNIDSDTDRRKVNKKPPF